ncbi:unnamed protein product [Protopolystoma xenopodis]|uniref:Uncharacterized protein n=1 Tax=Protopolystoma xenopodis TaxID=117903 RepID=A0A448WKL5_9PLAT|nr:unnamed protein product [Protopolystoma xenopodis]
MRLASQPTFTDSTIAYGGQAPAIRFRITGHSLVWHRERTPWNLLGPNNTLKAKLWVPGVEPGERTREA